MRQTHPINPTPIFFNVPEAREFLMKNGHVYTLRKTKKSGKYSARWGSYFKFEPIGDIQIEFIKEVREKAELIPYVAKSGFKDIRSWQSAAKGATFLHCATLI